MTACRHASAAALCRLAGLVAAPLATCHHAAYHPQYPAASWQPNSSRLPLLIHLLPRLQLDKLHLHLSVLLLLLGDLLLQAPWTSAGVAANVLNTGWKSFAAASCAGAAGRRAVLWER